MPPGPTWAMSGACAAGLAGQQRGNADEKWHQAIELERVVGGTMGPSSEKFGTCTKKELRDEGCAE